MGRKDKKPVETPPPPPPLPTAVAATTTSSTTASSSSTSTAPNPAISSPSPSPSSHSSDDDSVSSDTPPPPPPPPPSHPTPVKQPRSKPAAAAVAANTASTTTLALPATSAKRPAETTAGDASAGKRPKKELPPGTTPQKALFQRVWSDEDEIVILKGMIEYRGLKGSDPMSNVDDFLEFIKKSLHVHDANKGQIVSKVRRLKNRFLNAKKAENDGKKKRISDPHEVEVFELSKRIWLGPELGDEKRVVDNGGVVTVAAVAVEKGKNVVEFGAEFGFSREEEAVLKEGLKVMRGGEKAEVEKAVEKANVAYLEAYLLKLKVLEIAAKKVLQGIRDDKC